MKLKNILNTILTILVGYWLLGWKGIFISLIPDLFLIRLLPDLWKGKNTDRLTGILLNFHLYSHSITFIIQILIISLFFKINLYIVVIWLIHILLDYLTHDINEPFFCGYYPFYPLKLIKIKVKNNEK